MNEIAPPTNVGSNDGLGHANEAQPLTERLRAVDGWRLSAGMTKASALRLEAAAEIDRLRTVAENTVSLLEHLTNSHQSATKHAMCWRVLEQAREVLKA